MDYVVQESYEDAQRPVETQSPLRAPDFLPEASELGTEEPSLPNQSPTQGQPALPGENAEVPNIVPTSGPILEQPSQQVKPTQPEAPHYDLTEDDPNSFHELDEAQKYEHLMRLGVDDMGKAESLLAEHVAKSLESNTGFEEQRPSLEGERSGDDEMEVWKALKQNGFKFKARGDKGNAVAGRFARALDNDAELKGQYAAAQGHAGKDRVRRQWAEKEYTSFMEARTQTDKYTEEQETEGTFLSLNRIAVEEGGGSVGMQAAINYAMNAAKAGPKFVEYNEWTKQATYNYIVKKQRDKSTQEWSLSKKWTRDGNSGSNSQRGHSGDGSGTAGLSNKAGMALL